jgi:transposase-like protein
MVRLPSQKWAIGLLLPRRALSPSLTFARVPSANVPGPPLLPRRGGSSFRGLLMTVVDIDAGARLNGAAASPILLPTLAGPEPAPALPTKPPAHRSPIRAYPQELHDRGKALYQGTAKSVDAIAKEIGVARTTINTWARQEDWVRFAGAPPLRADAHRSDGRNRRSRLMGRLFGVYGRQLSSLERRTQKDAPADEKDARTLSVLAKTLETLIALDRDDGAKKPESVDRGDYKQELARYLSRWAEEGEDAGGESKEGDAVS